VALQLVDIDLIRDAAELIRPYAVRTPLLASPWPGLWLKPENLQPIGAFKIRGAVTAISRLDPEVRARGVLAHSSGNHAQAVAFAAAIFGVGAHIVIPDNAPARKIQATVDLGATVELVPVEQRFSRPLELAEETGKAMIPPFDHPDVISGQGTIGLEIAADLPDVATVLVPVSGGGLISGVAAAITALLPNAKVVGVEPELAGDAAESFRAGRRIPWTPAQTARTMADGLRTFSVGELPWAHISTQVHDIITVTEDEIADATRRLILQARLVAEPSGAVATAAYLHHRDQLPGGPTVAVLSGGNIDPAVLRALLADV
jgi:threonine dehydratase